MNELIHFQFLFFPLLGVIIPLIFWILKKDKVKKVSELGKSILNFEMTWSIILFSYFILLFSAIIFRVIGGFIDPTTIIKIYIPVIILYIYNFILILLNTIIISQGKECKSIPAFRF